VISPRGTAREFGEFLERTVGHIGYLMGTRGQRITQAMIDYRLASPDYARWHDTIRTYAPRWLTGNPDKGIDGQDAWIVADCEGWLDGFWNGVDRGKAIRKPYTYGDTSTYTQWGLVRWLELPNGTIDTLPTNCPYPIALHKTGHVGFWHNEKVYQSRGTAYGTVITGLSANNWTNWYMIPYLDYEGWTPREDDMIYIRYGDGRETAISSSPAVKATQKALVRLGYLVDADGRYGPGTRDTVATYKIAYGLPDDGTAVCGDMITVMLAQLASLKSGVPQADYDLAQLQVNNLTDANFELMGLNAGLKKKITDLQPKAARLAELDAAWAVINK